MLYFRVARPQAICGAGNRYRWVVLETPWWECVAAGLPFLVCPGDTWTIQPPADYRPEAFDVVLNPLRAPELWALFADNAHRIVMYETENILDPACYWRRVSRELRAHCPELEWWNYSAANGRPTGDKLVPLRQIHPLPRRPLHERQQPVDVLFVGSLNERRSVLLERLRAAGLRVLCPTAPVFGERLARLERCAALLVNVHHYTPGVFESFRCVPALHRGTPVISESSEEGEGSEWCRTVPYEGLVDEIRAALSAIDTANLDVIDAKTVWADVGSTRLADTLNTKTG